MSFSPLPAEFLFCLQELKSRTFPQILDLGSGGGFFASLLAAEGLPTWGLDLMPRQAGAVVDLRGDALAPPIRPGSLDCLLAGNLIHHLLAQDSTLSFIDGWLELLKPGGWLFIFGDEPAVGDDPAASNYGHLQDFLASLMPERRGVLISRASFIEQVSALSPELTWQSGLQKNEQLPDIESVRRMLGGSTGSPPPILRAIEKSGLSYGRYWWASAQKV